MKPDSFDLSAVPAVPGVYAMYDKTGRVAYVGVTNDLKSRINQHLYRRDSSVVTGVSATGLNPDKISSVSWWLHESFGDKDSRIAAELVAFDLLDPALRSRGTVTAGAKDKLALHGFREEMTKLFKSDCTGTYVPKNLDILWKRIADLALRVDQIEASLASLTK